MYCNIFYTEVTMNTPEKLYAIVRFVENNTFSEITANE